MAKLFKLLLAAVAASLAVACATQELDGVNNRLDSLESRVSALEKLCQEMNTNISSLQGIVTAMQSGDYITSVNPITTDGVAVGYTITFAKGQPITIYHGEDGADGKDGANGKDGKDGKDGANGQDGADGHTPVIGVKQDTDGIWYWTLDGQWLLDDNGQKIKAVGVDGKDGADGKDGQNGKDGENGKDGQDGTPGKDGENGKDGQDGADGKDGITPQLKIEEGYWYVSTDNGQTWVQLGKAIGENGKDGVDGKDGKDGVDGVDGDSMFQSVTVTDTDVTFVTSDGQTFVVKRAAALSIEFDSADLVVMSTNATRDIHYTITSGVDDITIEALSSADIKVKVVKTDAKTGALQVNTGAAIDEYSKVVVLVSNGSQAIMRTLNFEKEAIEVEENTTKEVSDEGGEVTLEFFSNVPCHAVIPEDAKSWISVAPETKGMERQTIELIVQPNNGLNRSATINVVGDVEVLNIILSYTITQEGIGGGVLNGLSVPPDNEIWYRTTNNELFDVGSRGHFTNPAFNVSVISNTYENGFGIIKCEGSITQLNDGAFYSNDNTLTELYLPDCVEGFGTCAIYLTKLKTLRIPANLAVISRSGLVLNNQMESFYGAHVSDDGKCVIVDGTLYAFAGKGIEKYIIPAGTKIIAQRAFQDFNQLKSINISEGVETIEDAAFLGLYQLESVTFPKSLISLGSNVFSGCYSISGFYGNEKFHTPDNRCLIIERDGNPFDNVKANGKWVSLFAGKDLTEYSIPEGIVGIGSSAFAFNKDLRSLSLPSSLVEIEPGAFGESAGARCQLEAVYGNQTSLDHKCIVIDGCLKQFVAVKGITKYDIPKGITSIDWLAFAHCPDLEEINTGDNIVSIGAGCFIDCPKLSTITLSARLEKLIGTNPFDLNSLKTVYFRSAIPPLYRDQNDGVYEGLHFYVPEEALTKYSNHPGWKPFKSCFIGHHYNDLTDLDYYISSDYSKDGCVFTLQTATEGNGIDFVLMGDGYCDRQIDDGTYRNLMEKMYEYCFTEEPYKTYKNLFNVYYVNVVSETEGFNRANGTALFGNSGDGTLVHESCINYALKAIEEERMNEATIIVGFNSSTDPYDGSAFMFKPDSFGDYSSGLGLAFLSSSCDDELIKELVHHEACGHAFVKLADEYENNAGPIPEDSRNAHIQDRINYGWNKNIDFTDDPSAILWNEFLSDERYADEGVGIFEGGNCFEQGVWRPSENSIMRYNTGGFNAPSRYAIWYRIGKLAYGESWEGSYEDFVAYDAVNRTPAAVQRRSAQRRNYVEKPLPQLPPPVVVGHSWREELQKK